MLLLNIIVMDLLNYMTGSYTEECYKKDYFTFN
jgi:hypothetical protein